MPVREEEGFGKGGAGGSRHHCLLPGQGSRDSGDPGPCAPAKRRFFQKGSPQDAIVTGLCPEVHETNPANKSHYTQCIRPDPVVRANSAQERGARDGGRRAKRKGHEEELSASPLSSVRSSPWPLPSGCEQEKAPYLARNRRRNGAHGAGKKEKEEEGDVLRSPSQAAGQRSQPCSLCARIRRQGPDQAPDQMTGPGDWGRAAEPDGQDVCPEQGDASGDDQEGCSGETPAPCDAVSLCPCLAVALCPCVTVSPLCCVVVLCRCVVSLCCAVSLFRCFADALTHWHIDTLKRSALPCHFAVSPCHCVAVALCLCIAVLSCPCFAVSPESSGRLLCQAPLAALRQRMRHSPCAQCGRP